MGEVVLSGGWYVVMVNGRMLGQFGRLFDANTFAICLIRRGEIASVTLPSGLVLDDF